MIALVAVLAVGFGLAAGYNLAPSVRPSPAPPSNVPSRAPSPAPTSLAAVPTDTVRGTAEIPPSDGLSIAQALGALDREFGAPAVILSAGLTRYPAVSSDWVWQFVVPYTTADCGQRLTSPAGATASPRSKASARPCRTLSTTEMVLLDYRTGLLLLDRIPAG